MNVNLNKYENMVITDHNIEVPLNYDSPEDRKINIFIEKFQGKKVFKKVYRI